MKDRAMALIIGVLFLPGCELFTSTQVCPVPGIEAAVKVEVTDAITGEYLALHASGYIERDDFRETMRRIDDSFAEDRYPFADGNGPGTYQVFVEAEGYEPWSRTAAAVAVECGGLRGADLDAHLVKE